MQRAVVPILLAFLLLLPISIAGEGGEEEISLTVWHSFAAESQEEATFLDAVQIFEQTRSHPT